MTAGGVPNDDMPNFLRPGRRDAFPISDTALAALLAGTEPPTGSAPGLQPVADVLAALKAGPTGAELTGETTALAEFRWKGGVSAQPHRPHQSRRRRPRVLTSLLGANAAVAAVLAALGLGGLATAAFAGVLPAPVQRLAHDTFGAPDAPKAAASSPASLHPGTSRASVSPATYRAAKGMCRSYARARLDGTAAQQAVALRNLIKAAGGMGNVARYCGAAPDPARSRAHPQPPAGKRVPPGRHPHPHGKGHHKQHGQRQDGNGQGDGGNGNPSSGGGNGNSSSGGGNGNSQADGTPRSARHSHGTSKGGTHSDQRAAGRQRAHQTPHATGPATSRP